MRLTSARDLKQQLLKELRVVPGVISSFSAQGERPARPPLDGVAIGITAVKSDRFLLAVRIQKPGPATKQVVQHLQDEAVGEADVRVLGEVQAQCGCGPLASGSSAAHPNVTAGTVGPFVKVSDERSLCVVSNNHVFADCNRGSEGDEIVHPSPYDLSQHACDRIGTLAGFVRLLGAQPNEVDAALCRLDDGVDVDPRIGGTVPFLGEGIEVGMAVEKVGRTTGHTHGIVTAFEVDNVTVGYQGIGTFTFDGQIEVHTEGAEARFSEGGDSGSLVFESLSGQAVGLLFAGATSPGSDGYATFVNPLPAVLDYLHASLAG
ncbi:hypothetical protein [Kitasatospora sp. NPDC050463]|uniref:hypothetical protein n=1 Tax=Kitasatospora sp. NPDC050463 TaxID=3155786 RepID=UPI0033C69259